MNCMKAIAIASCLALCGLFFVPNSQASDWDKRTILTVNHPVSVSGTVLQPGRYVMKLMDSPSNRHIVQIFNEDETKLEATIQAMPNFRIRPTDETVIKTEEAAIGTPTPVTAWFYPGDDFGQEFRAEPVTQQAAVTYKQEETVEIARAEPQPAPAPAPAPAPEPQPAPQPEQPPQPAPAPVQQPERLPATGSPLPLVALGGFLSLGAGLAVRKLRSV